jgi:diaminopimelate epimerase
MMKLRFSKMQGLGNDFVVLDGISQPVALSPVQVRRIADRHFGIGCDQLLLVERPANAVDADFRYRIFNADGGEVEQCGNGARCFVRFVHDKGLTHKQAIRVETLAGLITPRLEADGQVTVDMGPPVLEPRRIPFDSDSRAIEQPLQLPGEAGTVSITAVSMGNPHAVQVVEDVEVAPVRTQGPLIENHPRFPQRVNAGYLQVVDRHHIRLRVWERGAGETLACGTGACAAVVAGISRGLLDSPVRVTTRGGDLLIAWAGAAGVGDHVNSGHGNPAMPAPVLMTGPAVTVFDGEIDLDE